MLPTLQALFYRPQPPYKRLISLPLIAGKAAVYVILQGVEAAPRFRNNMILSLCTIIVKGLPTIEAGFAVMFG